MIRSFVLIQTAVFVALAVNLRAAEFVEIGPDLGAASLSADGHIVVGFSPRNNSQAFAWSLETGMQLLGVLPGDDGSQATDVTGDGFVVVGVSYIRSEDNREPFLWTKDKGMIGLGHLPGSDDAISNVRISDDAATVVGSTRRSDGQYLSAFRWTQEIGMVGLMPPGMNVSIASAMSADGSMVVGTTGVVGNDASYDGFIWHEETGFQVLGPKPDGWERTFPWLVSADGRVVFGKDSCHGCSFGSVFRWTADDGVQMLPDFQNSRQFYVLRDLTPDGSIVVGATWEGTTATIRASIWDERHGTRDLRELLVSEHGLKDADLPILYQATGISADARAIIGSHPDSENRGGWAIYLDKPLVSPWGDLNDDHYRDAVDIDLLARQLRTANPNAEVDLTNDGQVDARDHEFWVHEIAKTFFGDANLDGQFNSSDLVFVFKTGHYEDQVAGNSGWATGDWNGDSEFSTSDLVLAFQDGGYEQGSRAVARAVPEPTSCISWAVSAIAMVLAHRTVKRRGER